MLRNVSLLRDAAARPGLSCIVQVESTRRVGDETSVERRWYISSAGPGRDEEVARACRLHWGVENGLHWCLDVTFREDDSRVRSGNAAQNLSRVRRAALNLLKAEKTCRRGVQGKRFRASVDHAYLLKVIGMTT